MNPAYVFTPEAASDLESTWQYVANEADEGTAAVVHGARDLQSFLPGRDV